MSNRTLNAVWTESRSTGASRLVLLAMADEANDDGYLTAYRRSQSHLGSKANVPERTVRRAIDALVEIGEVEVLAVGSGRDQADYRIHLPGLGGEPDGRSREDISSGGVRTPRPDQGGRDVRTRADTSSSPSSPSSPLAPSTPSPCSPPAVQSSLLPEPAERPTLPSYASAGRHDLAFAHFWDAYPRKAGKIAARKAWDRALRRAPDATIIAGALRYAADPNREDEYTKHPATWLNGGCWDDEPLPARGRGRDANRTERAIQRVAGTDVPPPNIGSIFANRPSRKALGA